MSEIDNQTEPSKSSNDEYKHDEHEINRRATLQLLAIMGGASALSSAAGAGDDSDRYSTKVKEKAETDAVPAGTDALLSYIDANYGKQLNRDELARVRDDIASDLRAAKSLDTVDLDYTVDPAFTFRAYREDDCR